MENYHQTPVFKWEKPLELVEEYPHGIFLRYLQPTKKQPCVGFQFFNGKDELFYNFDLKPHELAQFEHDGAKAGDLCVIEAYRVSHNMTHTRWGIRKAEWSIN